MAENMAPDCGESRLQTASWRHDRGQETHAAGAAQGRTGKTRPAREVEEGRGDRRPAGPRADPLRRLAVQWESDGFLACRPERSEGPHAGAESLVARLGPSLRSGRQRDE